MHDYLRDVFSSEGDENFPAGPRKSCGVYGFLVGAPRPLPLSNPNVEMRQDD